MHLQNIVTQADQCPLRLHFLQSQQQKLPESPSLFDLSKNRFDDPFSLRINRSARFGSNLLSHAFYWCGVLSKRSLLSSRPGFSVFFFFRRHVTLYCSSFQVVQVILLAVAAVDHYHLR